MILQHLWTAFSSVFTLTAKNFFHMLHRTSFLPASAIAHFSIGLQCWKHPGPIHLCPALQTFRNIDEITFQSSILQNEWTILALFLLAHKAIKCTFSGGCSFLDKGEQRIPYVASTGQSRRGEGKSPFSCWSQFLLEPRKPLAFFSSMGLREVGPAWPTDLLLPIDPPGEWGKGYSCSLPRLQQSLWHFLLQYSGEAGSPQLEKVHSFLG